MKRRRPARPELPDAPAPDLSRFRGMDDFEFWMSDSRAPNWHLEAERRRRFEIQWSGTFVSGPPTEVPPPIAREFRSFL